jgi:hypothetical protein
MLGDDAPSPHAGPTWRLANARHVDQVARENGQSEAEATDTMQFVRDRVGEGSLTAMLDRQFQKRAPSPYPYEPAGRFHDGTWPCLYTALEAETARAEIQYHRRASLGRSDSRERRLFYWLIRMDFSGLVFDLRGRDSDWPHLVGPTADSYPLCQQLAAEAKKRGAAGLITPSARRAAGTCLPVFRRESVSGASLARVEVIDV